MMKLASLFILLGLPGLLIPAAAQQAPQMPSLTRADYERVIAAPGDEKVFQDFLAKLPKITRKEGDVSRTRYVIEGDFLATPELVRDYIGRNAHGQGEQSARALRRPGELLVITVRGEPVFWRKGDRTLSYAVDRKSFPTKDVYDRIVKNMATAARDWVEECPSCGISFPHLAEFDANPNLTSVRFIVSWQADEERFIASAFFPSDPVEQRYLLIGPQYLTTTFDPVGVLRHEIGHILGYRHEHITGIPGCSTEDNNWMPLTKPDPKSVMHYVCGGGGTVDLKITETDREGHQLLYR